MSYCYVLNRVLIQHLWATVLLTFSVFNTNMRTFHTLHSDRYSVTVSNCVYPKLSHVPHVSGSINHFIPSIYTKKARDMGPGWIWSWTGLHLRQSQSDHEWIQHGELYETLVCTDLRCCQLGCVYIYTVYIYIYNMMIMMMMMMICIYIYILYIYIYWPNQPKVF